MELDEFRPADEVVAEENRKRRGWLLAAVLLAAAVGIAAYLMFGRSAAPQDIATNSTEVPVEAERQGKPQPLGAEVERIDLPALDLSDPLVRDLVGKLSSRPEVAAWLATDGLIRNFVVSVDNLASGRTPARHVRRLAPRERFQVEPRDGVLVASTRAHARFDGLAETVASLDAADLARVYTLLKPRLDEAYAELGRPLGSFDAAMERAIVLLLQTPVPPADVELVPGGIGYRYRDSSIESLTAAQKQLLRMGPANAERVQQKLREVAAGLGIPESRLPPSRP